MLVGTKCERTPPYSAATRALPRALSAHCPAPRGALGGAGGEPWHAVGSTRSVRKRGRGMSSDTGRTEDATETHFGFQTVRSDQKAKLVGQVFSAVASRYDLMNDFMSAGLHRMWKDELVAALGPQRGMTFVDLAGGTGDVTFRIVDALRAQKADDGASSKIFVCDINAEMLQEGRRRAKERGYSQGDTWLSSADAASAPGGVHVEFVQGDAECLPFEDASVDALTIAFGLRNVTRTLPALKEVRRVLKKGGRFMCMEFSKVQDPLLRQAYDLYSFNVIPPVGGLVAGDAQPYQYLVESIRKWHDQETLAALMRQAGMKQVTYTNVLNGVVAVHSGFRFD
jgi:2-methoxy-6-polyprenyl-1,4-benzoquinol methylase